MTFTAPLVNELKARRQALGLSLTEVGERIGVGEQLLHDWECGNGSPRLEAVDAWATALGLTLTAAPAADAAARRGLGIDWDNRCVTVDGVPVRLTPMEWKALERLAASPGELVTHQALYRHLYGEDRPYCAQSTAIRVLITKLRRLLPLRIEAQWGRGYVVGDIAASTPQATGNNGGEHHRPAPRPIAPMEPKHNGHGPARAILAMQATTRMTPQIVERRDPPARDTVMREPGGTALRFLPQRAEELQIIERFLAERGATRCPDVATIERAPLPTLVWDKIKRKWVRPAGAEAIAR